MIRNLGEAADAGLEVNTNVCIVGAGTVGVFLAQLLRKRRLGVVVLEAGDGQARRPQEVGQQCIQRGIRYRGADQGRAFGLGGTSALWGGQMIPLMHNDMAERRAVGIDAWPINPEELDRCLQEARTCLGLPPAKGRSGDEALLSRRFSGLSRLDPDFALRLSEWLPFKTRNLARAFDEELRTDPGLEVWLNASVVQLELAPESQERVTAVVARSPNGRTLVVRPQTVVVCAGALESTRLMLELDEACAGRLTRSGAPLGRYFSDHLSVTCGRFECRDWRRYNHETAPVFENGIMRTPRLELTGQAQRRLEVTSAFAHFTFTTRGDTGFDVVRHLLRRRQGEQHAMALSPAHLVRAINDVSAMALWRGVYRRLWIPRQAELLLQVDIEQLPNENSRLSLSEDQRDEFGRKRLKIDWRITADDVRIVRTVAAHAIQAWQASPLGAVAVLRATPPDCFDDFETLYDVYHPTGTLRMGHSPETSVVDKDLRVWGLKNCFVSSTAAFPSAGSANPGLTHLGLTARLARNLTDGAPLERL